MEKLTKVSELRRDDGTLQTWSGIGGYSLTFLDEFENVVCGDCAEKAVASELQGAFIHWEGDPLTCEECNADIESVYGEI